MAVGRSKCVIKSAKKVLPHDEFIKRIRKSLYFGGISDEEESELEMSRPLAEYASELFSEPHKGHSLNRLNSVAASSLHATPCSLIMALIYLDRLKISDPGYVRRITPQELFVVSMMISTKFYAGHDEEIYLSDWAEDGMISETRLKQLELQFLCAIDWNIYVSNEHFFEKLRIVEETLARREGLRRGWLTYAELMRMLPSFTIAKFLLSHIAVLVVSYAAGVLTIVGAFFLATQIPGNALHLKTATTQATTATTATTTATEATPGSDNTTVLLTKNPSLLPASDTLQASQENCSCNTLNVEEELIKLERSYRAEAELEALRWRFNEMTSIGQLWATGNVQNVFNTQSKEQHSWLEHKAVYSDGKTGAAAAYNVQPSNALLMHNEPSCYGAESRNCTSVFNWTLWVDIVRLPPLQWFKFI